MRELHTFAWAFMFASRLIRATLRHFGAPRGQQLWNFMMPNAYAARSSGGVRAFRPHALRLAASNGTPFPPIDAGALLRRSVRLTPVLEPWEQTP
jgi:hypothetical protein